MIGASFYGELSGSISYSKVGNGHSVWGIGGAVGYGAGISPIFGAGLSGNLNYGISFIPTKK